MGGFFGVASKEECTFDLFFGTDYHSHLGTRRAGMVVYVKKGFDRAIHNRTSFRHKPAVRLSDTKNGTVLTVYKAQYRGC